MKKRDLSLNNIQYLLANGLNIQFLLLFGLRSFISVKRANFFCLQQLSIIQIRLEMADLNRHISDILAKNQSNTKNAIQQLFLLFSLYDEHLHHKIQLAILYSMQMLHEWENIMYYVEKWKLNDFRKGLISRMRRRLDESEDINPNINEREEIKRLVQQFWMKKSPKKEQNIYKQPFALKNMLKNLISDVAQTAQEQKQKQDSKVSKNQTTSQQQQLIDNSNHSKEKQQSNKQQFQNLDSNKSSNPNSKRQKADPLSSITGRPTILKKNSVFTNQIKTPPVEGINNQQKKSNDPNNSKKGNNSRIQNIMKRYVDKQQSKPTENWQNFGKAKQSFNKDEEFPIDKFAFGSNKKSNESDLAKKITLSPRKYDPTNKLVRITRNQPKQNEQRQENLHQFSFANSQKKENPIKNLANQLIKPIQPPQNAEPDRFVFRDNIKDGYPDDTLGEIDISSSAIKMPSPTQTPMFIFNDSKKKRSSNRFTENLQIDEELKLYDPNIKVRYFWKQIEKNNHSDTTTLFKIQFQKFIKDYQTNRT